MGKLISYISSLVKDLHEAFLRTVKSLLPFAIIFGLVVSFGGPEVIEIFRAFSKINVTSQANTNLAIHYGDKDAIVSRPFKDAMQACWYYHANYTNSHPYTVLWKEPKEERKYPKIRVIADPAYWYAHSCEMEGEKVKLIGTEYTKHSIEAQLEENNDFIPIASSDAYYRSELIFDMEGRVVERKVVKADYNCKIFSSVSVPVFGRCITAEPTQRIKIEELKEKISSFNELEIMPERRLEELLSDRKKEDKEYVGYVNAINFYIERRTTLHKNLVEKGCGVISIEPKPEKETGSLIRPSIAFLCFKESGSHVRLMQRQ